MKKISFSLMIFLAIFSSACKAPTPKGEIVTVSIVPQKFFVDRISGGDFSVMVMIPPGHSPATYEATPAQLRQLSQSALYFRIGHIPFEAAQMDNLRAVNRAMKVVDTSAGIQLITGEPEKEHGHHGHDHGGIDPHVWLSPEGGKVIARHIFQALAILKPKRKEVYKKNYETLLRDIEELDQESRKILAPKRGREFIVFHPVWTYYGRHYGLKQVPLEIDGKEPGPSHIRAVIDLAKKKNIRAILVQKEFSTHYGEAIAKDIDGKVIVLNPLAENWLDNMKKIALTFKNIL